MSADPAPPPQRPEAELYLAAAAAFGILTLLPPTGAPVRGGVLAAAGAALAIRPQVMRDARAWLGLALCFVAAIAIDPLDVGNHHFLGAYFCLATGVILWDRANAWREQWACNARWLLVGVMAFATLQKLLSPEYLRGDFWGYFLSFGMAGKFVFATGLWDGSVEAFRENRATLAALGATGLSDGASAQLAEPFPHFKTVALLLTWATLAAEATIALGFAVFRRSQLPHLLLLAFVALLILIRPEVEFAALLLGLGAAVNTRKSRRIQLAYGVGIGLCLVLSLALQHTDLGVRLSL